MTEQRRDHRPLAAVDVLDDHRDFDMSTQLDQTEFANLGERPVAARPCRGASKSGVIGWRVRDVKDGAIDTHQTVPAVECSRRGGLGQRSDDLGEEVTHRGHTQPLTGDTKARAMGRLFTLAQPPGMFEDLADRQVGEQPHGEHDPENDFMGQRTATGIDAAGGVERLLNVLGADNLFESRQSIQNPARFIGRQRTSSLMHASRSLLVASVFSKPKVTRGCDLRLFQRYWL